MIGEPSIRSCSDLPKLVPGMEARMVASAVGVNVLSAKGIEGDVDIGSGVFVAGTVVGEAAD